MVKLFNSGLDSGFRAGGPDTGLGSGVKEYLQTLGQYSSVRVSASQPIFVGVMNVTVWEENTDKFIFHFGLTVLFER